MKFPFFYGEHSTLNLRDGQEKIPTAAGVFSPICAEAEDAAHTGHLYLGPLVAEMMPPNPPTWPTWQHLDMFFYLCRIQHDEISKMDGFCMADMA